MRNGQPEWNQRELHILNTYYPNNRRTIEWLREALPKRFKKAIRSRAQRLGLRRWKLDNPDAMSDEELRHLAAEEFSRALINQDFQSAYFRNYIMVALMEAGWQHEAIGRVVGLTRRSTTYIRKRFEVPHVPYASQRGMNP